MEKQVTHKKLPLHSSQSDNDAEIEKKVDHILNAHTEVFGRKKQDNKPTETQSRPDQKEKARLFYVGNKKKSDATKTAATEKKSISIKKKKHLGFKKKKKENSLIKTKQNLAKKAQRTQEELPQFEESIAQVKTDEAAWLDQQIKAKMDSERKNETNLRLSLTDKSGQ